MMPKLIFETNDNRQHGMMLFTNYNIAGLILNLIIKGCNEWCPNYKWKRTNYYEYLDKLEWTMQSCEQMSLYDVSVISVYIGNPFCDFPSLKKPRN